TYRDAALLDPVEPLAVTVAVDGRPVHRGRDRGEILALGRRGRGRHPWAGRKTMVALWPPKPNEFDSTGAAATLRGAPATTSIGASSGSEASKLAVGGTTPSRMARSDATASTAPAAPIRCPTAPFTDVTGTPACPNPFTR